MNQDLNVIARKGQPDSAPCHAYITFAITAKRHTHISKPLDEVLAHKQWEPVRVPLSQLVSLQQGQARSGRLPRGVGSGVQDLDPVRDCSTAGSAKTSVNQ